MDRLHKVENHLHKMNEKAGIAQQGQDYMAKELDDVDIAQNNVNEQFVAYQQRNFENSREAQGNGDGVHDQRNEGATLRIPGNANTTKYAHKKPPELDGDVNLKGFDAWQRKYVDYYVLSGMDKASRQIQLANLQSYLATDMVDKLSFAMEIEDDT